MKFRLGCDLAYKVVDETVFIFNLEVARLPRHLDLKDRIVCTPDVARNSYTAPGLNNRYTRVLTPPGDLADDPTTA